MRKDLTDSNWAFEFSELIKTGGKSMEEKAWGKSMVRCPWWLPVVLLVLFHLFRLPSVPFFQLPFRRVAPLLKLRFLVLVCKDKRKIGQYYDLLLESFDRQSDCRPVFFFLSCFKTFCNDKESGPWLSSMGEKSFWTTRSEIDHDSQNLFRRSFSAVPPSTEGCFASARLRTLGDCHRR